MRSRETVWIEMPDGTRLAARLWLPDGPGPWPAILEYIPYRRRDQTRIRDESIHPRLAQAGYACLRVDIRGSGDSGGLMHDEYSEQEIRDGHDAVGWIAAQDWCDGGVAMVGKSWGAFSALQVAATRPPALRCVAPVMGTDDRWLEDIHFRGGALAGDNFWWGCIMQLYNALPPDPEIVEDWEARWLERLEAATFWPIQWLGHQTRDETWRRGSVAEDYGAIEVPIHCFGGWADLYRDTPLRLAQGCPGRVKVLMGPWAHLYPHEAVPGPRIDFVGELVRFFDHHLKGRLPPEEPPLRFWIQDHVAPAGFHAERPGRWVEEPSWPSPNVTDRELGLGAGTLGGPARGGPPLSKRSPQTYGSAGGDACSFAIPGDMPLDGRIDAGGALSFVSEPFGKATEILGAPMLELEVSADRPRAMVAAILHDMAPGGARTLISRGFLNLSHRESDTKPSPLTPGEAVSATVPLHAAGYRLPAGHRLALEIASAYWPIVWPMPEPVTLTVHPGRSVLRLPVRTATDMPKPRHLPPPPDAAPPRVRTVREGALSRTVTRDAATGAVIERVLIDGGVFGPVGRRRLLDTGTEIGSVSERVYSIHPDDPLCAKAVMTQEAVIERGDWRVRIETEAEQTSSATHFHLRARTRAYSGDRLLHEARHERSVPRDAM